MNTNCIDCIEVQNLGKISVASVKHCQWAESNARFLRMICASSSEEAVGGDEPVVDGYVCRQRFLRGYTFSREEKTVAQRTKKWWKVKRSTPTGSMSKEEDRKENKGKEKKKSNGRQFLIVLWRLPSTFRSCPWLKRTSAIWFFGLSRPAKA